MGGLLGSGYYFVAHVGALNENWASSEWQTIIIVEFMWRGRVFDMLKSDNVEGGKFN